MIKVLQVIGSLNSGGSQSMLMNLYRNIDRNKINFDFIVDRKKELLYADEIKKLGGKIYFLPQYKLYNHFHYKKAWSTFFKQHPEYKIIHGHVRSTASIYLKIAKKYGLKTIAHSHNTSSGKGILAIIKNILQYPLKYIADYCFGCSQKANEWLFGKKMASSDKAYILKNAIDTNKFVFDRSIREKIRRKYNITNELVIGNVARFTEVKNHKFLLEIFYEVLKKESNAKLMLIGTGELFNDIKEKAKELKIDSNVIFLGQQSNINELMQAMDIFALPSIYEGLPVTLIEAQATGMKCIISDVITDEVCVTNLIVKESLTNSVQQWGETILKECKNINRLDNNIKEKIIENGYDIKTTVVWLENFYESII